MADPTLRPTRKVLRSAGLLPESQPNHEVAKGERVPPQPEPVSRVFGPSSTQGGKTVVPLSRVRYADGTGRMVTRQVAVVEVSEDGLDVRYMPMQLPLRVLGLLSVAWNVYWVWRIVREWRAG